MAEYSSSETFELFDESLMDSLIKASHVADGGARVAREAAIVRLLGRTTSPDYELSSGLVTSEARWSGSVRQAMAWLANQATLMPVQRWRTSSRMPISRSGVRATATLKPNRRDFNATETLSILPTVLHGSAGGRSQPPAPTVHVRRTYSGRPSSSMRLSETTAMATSVVCRPSVRERSASPITRL